MASYTDLSRAWHNHQLNWTRTRKQTFLPPIIKPVPIRAVSATPLPVHSVAGADASVSTGILGGDHKDVDTPVIGPVAPASSVIASMEDEKGILTVLTDVPSTNKRKADEPIPTPAPPEKKQEVKDANFGDSNASTPGLGLEQITLNFPVNGLATYFPAPTKVELDEKDKMEYETDFDEKKN